MKGLIIFFFVATCGCRTPKQLIGTEKSQSKQASTISGAVGGVKIIPNVQTAQLSTQGKAVLDLQASVAKLQLKNDSIAAQFTSFNAINKTKDSIIKVMQATLDSSKIKIATIQGIATTALSLAQQYTDLSFDTSQISITAKGPNEKLLIIKGYQNIIDRIKALEAQLAK